MSLVDIADCKNCGYAWGLHHADTLQCPDYADCATWRGTKYETATPVQPPAEGLRPSGITMRGQYFPPYSVMQDGPNGHYMILRLIRVEDTLPLKPHWENFAFVKDRDGARAICDELCRLSALPAPETTGSAYDKAVEALAVVMDGDGWIAWCPEQGPVFYASRPFIQDGDEHWNPCWRSHGIEYEISEPFTIPKPEDWRNSLRRISDGQVVRNEEGGAA